MSWAACCVPQDLVTLTRTAMLKTLDTCRFPVTWTLVILQEIDICSDQLFFFGFCRIVLPEGEAPLTNQSRASTPSSGSLCFVSCWTDLIFRFVISDLRACSENWWLIRINQLVLFWNTTDCTSCLLDDTCELISCLFWSADVLHDYENVPEKKGDKFLMCADSKGPFCVFCLVLFGGLSGATWRG